MKKLLALAGMVFAPMYLALNLAVLPKIMMVLMALLISATGGIAFPLAFLNNSLALVAFGVMSATGFTRIQITGIPAIDLVLTAY